MDATKMDTDGAMQILFYKQTRYHTYYFVHVCMYVSATLAPIVGHHALHI